MAGDEEQRDNPRSRSASSAPRVACPAARWRHEGALPDALERAAVLAAAAAFVVAPRAALRDGARSATRSGEARREQRRLIEQRRLLAIEAATLRQAERIETVARGTPRHGRARARADRAGRTRARRAARRGGCDEEPSAPSAARWVRVRIGAPRRWSLSAGAGLVLRRAWELTDRARRRTLREMAEEQYLRDIRLAPKRGTIYDRHGAELAVSVDVDSVCANPREMPRRGHGPGDGRATARRGARRSIASASPRACPPTATSSGSSGASRRSRRTRCAPSTSPACT